MAFCQETILGMLATIWKCDNPIGVCDVGYFVVGLCGMSVPS